MAYLPLPISGFKSAVYIVRHRHHNHAIIGCMLKQTVFTGWEFMKNGDCEMTRGGWEMETHITVGSKCSICI